MLFLYIIVGIYAIALGIIGLFIGLFLANFTGMDFQKTCILFGGIGVMFGVMVGYRTVNKVIYNKNQV